MKDEEVVVLATVPQFASHMRQDVNPASAEQALKIASGMVTSRCGQDFMPGTSTELVTPVAGPWLYLSQSPVTAVTSVSLGGVAVSDFTVVGDRLYRANGWRVTTWSAPPVITVTYSHGGTVPDDVLGAVLAVAADVYGNPIGMSSETVGEYSYRLGGSGKSALDEVASRYAGPVGA